MYQNIAAYYAKNGQKKSKEDFVFSYTNHKIIYEVIRVIEGTPLFLDDHMTRLRNSLIKSDIKADVKEIEDSLLKVISWNQPMNKNIKIDVTDEGYRVYFMESFYPDEKLYQTGVSVTTAHIIRDNPNVKRLNMDYKKHIEEIKGDHFEVLLINDKEEITEGSRANLVFIKDRTLYSAPLEEILVGVTFKNILKMAEKADVSINYTSVKHSEMMKMEACFLTGTSLGILPIHQINDEIFNSESHELVLELRQAYQNEIKGEQ